MLVLFSCFRVIVAIVLSSCHKETPSSLRAHTPFVICQILYHLVSSVRSRLLYSLVDTLPMLMTFNTVISITELCFTRRANHTSSIAIIASKTDSQTRTRLHHVQLLSHHSVFLAKCLNFMVVLNHVLQFGVLFFQDQELLV